jgi:tetratricopeptide (TPR) repeat protein
MPGKKGIGKFLQGTRDQGMCGRAAVNHNSGDASGESERRREMIRKWNIVMMGALAAMLVCGSGIASAQYGGKPATQAPAQQPAANPAPKPLTLDKDAPAPAPVNAEEDATFKAFQDSPALDAKKKIELGEAFALKYPQSRYLPIVYNVLTSAYVQTGQVQKMEEVGDKEVALNPNDVQVLAVLGQTIPRALKSTTQDPAKELEKAERYSKRAIEITPTLTKPDTLTEESFTNAKNITLAMAHSGLGLVYIQRGKYADAIPELEQSVKIDPTPDLVNYYLLGLANLRTSHFEDAAAAYTKCAATPGPMQPACQKGAEEAKKRASTELSAPK